MILLQHEQHEFDSASVSPPVRRYVTPQFARTGGGAAQLNAGGGAPVPFGPIKQLAVGRGDTLLVTAHGMYPEAACHPHWALSLAGFVAGLVQQQPVGPPPTDGRQRVRVLPLLNVGLPLAAAVLQLAGGVPRAYLRVLLFNADSTLVDTHTQQLTSAALGNYEPLSLNIVVPQAGYATAYVATESEADVFFDDITIEHRQGLLVQENHYDPYGLELAGLSQSSPGLKALNQYTWNGKELQDEFGLNWHDHGWRFYDPQLGRWVVVDPDAEEGDQEGWTTYQFGLNNAVRYNDLDGRKPGPGGDVETPTLAATLYQTAAGLVVSGINTIMMMGEMNATMMPKQRAELGEDGEIRMVMRLPASNMGEFVSNLGSDGLDALNVAATFVGGGAAKGLTQGAGMLLAKTGSKAVVANSVAQAGKQTIKQRYATALSQSMQRSNNANVTVQRGGKDLFRVHKTTSGHKPNQVTQQIPNKHPKAPPGAVNQKDVPIRRKHVEQLERALDPNNTRYRMRTQNGKIVP